MFRFLVYFVLGRRGDRGDRARDTRAVVRSAPEWHHALSGCGNRTRRQHRAADPGARLVVPVLDALPDAGGAWTARAELASLVLPRRPGHARGRAQPACRHARRPAAVRAHGRASADRRHRRAADRARGDGTGARAGAAHPRHPVAAGARTSGRRGDGLGGQLLRLAHPGPVSGRAPPRCAARAGARDLPDVRDRDVDGAPGAAAEAPLVRQRREARVRDRGAADRDRARQRARVRRLGLLSVLHPRRPSVAHQPDGRSGGRRRADDDRGEPADDRAVLLAVPEGRARERGAPAADRLRARARDPARRGARRACGGRRPRRRAVGAAAVGRPGRRS